MPSLFGLGLFVLFLQFGTSLLAGALTLAPSLAAAQNMTPYWDDSTAAGADTTTDAGPRWHVGLRLGPYLPDIDDDRFGDPGPYERMFGDGSWMPALDVHRVFTTRYGQLGGGLSVGYFGKTADAFVPGTTVRSPGNENSLRMVPMELTAIYRASQLDDNWGIPLVPSVRGGLAYALWWVRRPDGDLAKACGHDHRGARRPAGGGRGDRSHRPGGVLGRVRQARRRHRRGLPGSLRAGQRRRGGELRGGGRTCWSRTCPLRPRSRATATAIWTSRCAPAGASRAPCAAGTSPRPP